MRLQLFKATLITALVVLVVVFIQPVKAQIVFDEQYVEHLFNEARLNSLTVLQKSDFGTSNKVTTTAPLTHPSCTPPNSPPCLSFESLNLPDGVSITGYELNYQDNDPGAMQDTGCLLGFGSHDQFQTMSMTTTLVQFQSAGVTGAQSSGVLAPVMSHVVDNNTNYYIQLCILTSVNASVLTTKVYWKRAISMEPGVASFSDVPTSHPFFQAVEAMVASGVTGGCGGGKYCPDATVTRGQMAAFMARSLGL